MNYRSDIDGLRAVAVGLVVANHAFAAPIGGFIGVDVFFVISGYLICRIIAADIAEQRFSLLEFYERRIRRLLPALAVVLAATLSTGWALLLPDDLTALNESALAALVFSANLFFWSRSGYFEAEAEETPLLHLWSLGVEEQFYLIFPLLLLAIALLLRRRNPGLARAPDIRRPALIAIAAIAATSLLAAEIILASDADAAFYAPHLRAWELLLGAGLAVAGRMRDLTMSRPRAEAAAWVGLALIIGSAALISPARPFPGLAAAPACLGTALLIAAGAGARRTAVAALLSLAPMRAIGRISYPLYLWHWPVLVFARYASPQPLDPLESAFCVAIAIALSALTYALIERPIRDRRWLAGPRPIFAAAGAFAALSAAAAITVIATDGAPRRLSPELRAVLAAADALHDRRDCHFVSAERLRTETICIRGDDRAAPSFVLAGDSHADALSPAIFDAASRVGLSGWQVTAPGWRPLPGVRRQGAGDRFPERTAAFIEWLHRRPDAKIVILSGYWLHQAAGVAPTQRPAVWLLEPSTGPRITAPAQALEAALLALADSFPDHRFLLLDDAPAGEALDPAMNARRLWLAPTSHRDAIDLPRATYEAQRAGYLPVLKRVAEARANISLHNLHAALCDPARCPAVAEGRALYRDADHVSVFGAGRLRPAFEHLLRDAAGIEPVPDRPAPRGPDQGSGG